MITPSLSSNASLLADLSDGTGQVASLLARNKHLGRLQSRLEISHGIKNAGKNFSQNL
jgi:hypothetical protein